MERKKEGNALFNDALNTFFYLLLYGVGHMVKRDKIILPIIYNRRNVDIGKLMKEEYLNLQTVMKKPIMARPVIAYNLKDILVSIRLPTNPVTL